MQQAPKPASVHNFRQVNKPKKTLWEYADTRWFAPLILFTITTISYLISYGYYYFMFRYYNISTEFIIIDYMDILKVLLIVSIVALIYITSIVSNINMMINSHIKGRPNIKIYFISLSILIILFTMLIIFTPMHDKKFGIINYIHWFAAFAFTIIMLTFLLLRISNTIYIMLLSMSLAVYLFTGVLDKGIKNNTYTIFNDKYIIIKSNTINAIAVSIDENYRITNVVNYSLNDMSSKSLSTIHIRLLYPYIPISTRIRNSLMPYYITL